MVSRSSAVRPRAGSRLTVLLLTLFAASAADAAPQTYDLTGSFNMIAGATGNIVGYPTDPSFDPGVCSRFGWAVSS